MQNEMLDELQKCTLPEMFHQSIRSHDNEKAVEILNSYPDPGQLLNYTSTTSLVTAVGIAIKSKNTHMLDVLLAHTDTDLNKKHTVQTPLCVAAKDGDVEVVDKLLRAGAEPQFRSKNGDFPLYLAARHGHIDVVKRLLQTEQCTRTMQNFAGNTALMEAVSEGHYNIVECLLDDGFDVNAKNNSKETALHIACLKGHGDIVKLLLDSGAVVNCPARPGLMRTRRPYDDDKSLGLYPLHYAAHAGSAEVAKMLLERGADVNARMINLRNALHTAVKWDEMDMANSLGVIDVLVEHGCEVNALSMESDEKKTPLLMAVERGHPVMVQKLIDAGADINLPDRYGNSPLFVAMHQGNAAMALTLIRAGADLDQLTYNKTSPFCAGLNHLPVIPMMLLLAGCKLREMDRLSLDVALKTHNLPGEDKAMLRDLAFGFPSLKQRCRCFIQKLLGRKTLQNKVKLPLPPSLQDFVGFKDLEDLSKDSTCPGPTTRRQ